MSSPKQPIFPATHFARFGRWLEMESHAERQRLEERRQVQSSARAERSGETLLDLVVRNHASGLGGRYLVTLHKRSSPDRLPWHRSLPGMTVARCRESSARDGSTAWKLP